MDKLVEEVKRVILKTSQIDKDKCAHGVTDSEGRGTWRHQCYRKPVEILCGYGFCKAHAKRLKSEAGLLESVVYYVGGYYYGPFVLEVKDDGSQCSTDGLYGSRYYFSRSGIKALTHHEKVLGAVRDAIDATEAHKSGLLKEVEKLDKHLDKLREVEKANK